MFESRSNSPTGSDPSSFDESASTLSFSRIATLTGVVLTSMLIGALAMWLIISPDPSQDADQAVGSSDEQVERLADHDADEQRYEEDEATGDRVYTVTEQDPAPVGGLRALTEQVSYPSRAAKRGVEGRVYVQATINPDGTVREAEVLRGIGYGADEEALRIVREADFEPAQVRGEPVAARSTVWVQFSLDAE